MRVVLAHFWKILAATGLIGGLCVWYGVVSGWRGTQETSRRETTIEDDGLAHGHGHHFRLLRDLIDKQSQPAAIVFKTQAPAAVGYLDSIDDECVVLRSLYKEESREQTILVPWENILYIRLNTKTPPPEQEVTASRDSRSRSGVRARR